ncbi:MAG TPA: NAD(P)/FAD-dependent oxidoreductase [Burkholderiales bacterium]|nr:NAD(P)/FAD-dependent oxidoreductase [Burkholderiales bacterium]
MTATAPPEIAAAGQDFEVAIVGAGITGIAAAREFGRTGLAYIVLERCESVGGVWLTHRWHGARCDSDIIKYSYSFRPLLAERCLLDAASIQSYLRDVTEEFGIAPHIRFGATVTRAEFTNDRWRIHTSRGIFTARFLLNGNGYFADQPHVPKLPGLADFRGEVVHSVYLDGRRTFHDKRVVLVGSGATAICCAPALARVSKSLVLLQRSPSYIFEAGNGIGWTTRACQSLFRHGIRWPVHALRHALQLRDDVIFVAFRRFPWLGKSIFRRHWLATVGRDNFEAHFRPDYGPWQQRIPVAVGLKAKLRSGEIVMRTGEIARFESGGVVLKDDSTVACDVCVLATGHNLEFLKFELVVEGRPVSVDRLGFYKGVMMGSIPNYFHPFGVLHSAWTQRIETIVRFIAHILAHMRREGYRVVMLDQREVEYVPSLASGYIRRSLDTLPRLYGVYHLQSLDRLLSYRFDPSQFRFR